MSRSTSPRFLLCAAVCFLALATSRVSAAATPDAGASPGAGAPPVDDGVSPNKACLQSLRERGVDFVEVPTKGVRTPIRLAGANLGPLRLVLLDRRAGGVMPVMDCELGRALLDAAAVFTNEGIRDLFFSGIYEYRPRRRSKKLSEHAHGLAIDVHQFGTADGRIFDVQRDFEQGVGDWDARDQVACVGSPEHPEARVLREVACALRASSAFREIITGDDNSDHDNHFHIESFPDPLARAKSILSHREPTNDD
ncbi:MAG TPA: extensin family protein [Polyangia bacterium]|nr:extensin family protein [Polyangia bacterium]